MAGWLVAFYSCACISLVKYTYISRVELCRRRNEKTRARARANRQVSIHERTPTRGVTGKGGLVGETTGSATPRSWQLFPRWADRSVGRIQPSRAPSIMAPFSSFPYLRQYGWHGFLSLLGSMLRHKHTPSFILLYRPNDVRATFRRAVT